MGTELQMALRKYMLKFSKIVSHDGHEKPRPNHSSVVSLSKTMIGQARDESKESIWIEAGNWKGT